MNDNTFTTWFALNSKVFAVLNVPASVFSILLNIFFLYCMVFQQDEQAQLKQPLNVLQRILVACNIAINICTLLNICFIFNPPFLDRLSYILLQCGVYIMITSVTSSFWQNVFYYLQITPAKSYFIRLKKNLRAIIYCNLLITGILYLFQLSLFTAIQTFLHIYSRNDTSTIPNLNDGSIGYLLTWYSVFCMTIAHLILNLCGMSTSSCATVIFLWKHLRNMEKSNTVSSPRFQRQIRTTIRSIAIHSVQHFTGSVWVIIDLVLIICTEWEFDPNGFILCTIVSSYALTTTITLGFTQTLFRQQLAYAWKNVLLLFVTIINSNGP